MKFLFFNRFPDPDDTASSNEPDNSSNQPAGSSGNSNTTSSGDSSTGSSDSSSTEPAEGGTSNEPGNSNNEPPADSSSDPNNSGDDSSANPGDSTTTGDASGTTDTTDTATTNSTTDTEGFKLHSGGTWNNSATLNVQGGQGMHFQIKNVNVLGTTLSIESNLGGKKTLIIGPAQTADMRFACFGREPMNWTFNVSTNSDAFMVAWKLFSSWIPGDPPNG